MTKDEAGGSLHTCNYWLASACRTWEFPKEPAGPFLERVRQGGASGEQDVAEEPELKLT